MTALQVETRSLPQRARRSNVSYTIDSASEENINSSEEESVDSYIAPQKSQPRKSTATLKTAGRQANGVIDLTDAPTPPKTPKKPQFKSAAVTPKSVKKSPIKSAQKPAAKKMATSTSKENSARKKAKRDFSSSDDSYGEDDVPVMSQLSSSSRRSSRSKQVSYVESSSEGWNGDSDE